MRCQLCGYEFDETQLTCHASCAFNKYCTIICCPNCGYQVVDDSRSRLANGARWMLRRLATPRQKHVVQPIAPSDPAQCPLSKMTPGTSGRVVSIVSDKPGRLERLQVFGLIEGARISLMQRHPEYIVEVGFTELTIERDVADQIMVEI